MYEVDLRTIGKLLSLVPAVVYPVSQTPIMHIVGQDIVQGEL